jgi:outer membrane biosynthesis protein TonB
MQLFEQQQKGGWQISGLQATGGEDGGGDDELEKHHHKKKGKKLKQKKKDKEKMKEKEREKEKEKEREREDSSTTSHKNEDDTATIAKTLFNPSLSPSQKKQVGQAALPLLPYVRYSHLAPMILKSIEEAEFVPISFLSEVSYVPTE